MKGTIFFFADHGFDYSSWGSSVIPDCELDLDGQVGEAVEGTWLETVFVSVCSLYL